uniref:Uncharacterized protein n=1 Tax=Alexandrium andersonii TaxID=327968 RepID=A0A7S2NHY5_9DINO|mmetsp:Transcript_97036/g.217431  ORF Transcript_97036/g.217431 Transcript_97036/m.217431 type:complete len:293 (+) Transcript_97036:3-881(+)
MSEAMTQEVPSHSWVMLLDIHSVWSPRFMQVVHPAMRKAAVDARIVALRCARHARAKDSSDAALDVGEVDEALKSGAVFISDQTNGDLQFMDLIVRIKSFRGFFDSTPVCVLPHPVCAHRFCHRMEHTYGKKVQTLTPPEDEWLRWHPVAPAVVPAVEEVDTARGRALVAGTRPAQAGNSSEGDGPGAAPEAGSAEKANDTGSGVRFRDAEEAAQALAQLRRAVERKIVQHAGEALATKDARALAMEQMTAFIEDSGLDSVIGVQRWAKQTAMEMCEAAAHLFAVDITDEQK